MLLLMACQLPSVYAWVALRLQSTRRKLQLGVLYPQYQQRLCTNSYVKYLHPPLCCHSLQASGLAGTMAPTPWPTWLCSPSSSTKRPSATALCPAVCDIVSRWMRTCYHSSQWFFWCLPAG